MTLLLIIVLQYLSIEERDTLKYDTRDKKLESQYELVQRQHVKSQDRRSSVRFLDS